MRKNIYFFLIILTQLSLPLLSLPATATASTSITYEAANIPWSGYWWPYKYGGLATGKRYLGHPAPLEKYELLQQGWYPGKLTSWYKDKYYNPGAKDWEGLCGAWAVASVYEHIDFVPSSEDNIIFRVGDKKGLVTIVHYNDVTEYVKNPDAVTFHEWLLKYLGQEKTPIVADLDSGEEIWNHPIYRVDLTTSVVGNTESVSALIHYVSDNVEPDYIGTKTLYRRYTYELELDNDNHIIGGRWTGDSINGHPGHLLAPLAVRSNPYIDYEEVLRIARSKDDFLETNGTAELPPGQYNLILLDRDLYRLTASQGDTIQLTIIKQEGSDFDIKANLNDGSGSLVAEGKVTEDGALEWLLTADNPPYTLRLSQPDYSDPNIYSLEMDVRKSFNREFPYLPKNVMWWNGFALTNPGETKVDQVMLTSNDEEGKPLHTLLGPLSLAPGEKKLALFENLSWRRHELPQTSNLSLRADGELKALNLNGSSTQLLSQLQKQSVRSRFIIPETAPSFDPEKSMTGILINESFLDANVTLRAYNSYGDLVQSAEVTIDSRQQMQIIPGEYPFYNLPMDGWLEVTADNNSRLNGFHRLTGSGKTRVLFALTADAGTKIVPHIARPGVWDTKLTLINADNATNKIVLHPTRAMSDTSKDTIMVLQPHEKRTLSLQEKYAYLPGAPLYNSIIEVSGELPFSGYFTYTNLDSDEPASLPLIGDLDLAGELIMPHSPNSGNWWTGIGVFNPLNTDQTIRIEPYDNEGDLLPDMEETFQISGGGYQIFTLATLYGNKADDISFIKFKTEGGSGLIGGFYLYGGKHENSGVSGGVM